MRSLLGLLLALIVSGDDETIEVVLKDSVLLPCDCPERSLDKEFGWQKEEPKEAVFKYNGTTSNFYDRYQGRAQIFLSENSNNCSILLANVTAEDHGKYRCRFQSGNMYQRQYVYLNVSASFTVCQTDEPLSGGVKVFRCEASGHYGEARIQWKLHGQLLTHSTATNITHTREDASAGLYRFISRLSTKLNRTSELTCEVKAKDISVTLRSDCGGRGPAESSQIKPGVYRRYHYFNIFPIICVVLVLSILLKYHRHSSQSSPRIRNVETDNFYC